MTERKYVYIFDQESYSFDIIYIFIGLIPAFLLEYFYSFYFDLYLDMRLPSVEDHFILGKLFIFNVTPLFIQNFLKDLGFFSYAWNAVDVRTPGNGYPTRFPWLYSNHIHMDFFFFDPLYQYDNIFASMNNMIFPYSDGYKRIFNISFFYAFINQRIIWFLDFIFGDCYKKYNIIYYIIIFFILYFLYFKWVLTWRSMLKLKYKTNINIKLLVYLDKIYDIQKVKWTNYLKKIWF